MCCIIGKSRRLLLAAVGVAAGFVMIGAARHDDPKPQAPKATEPAKTEPQDWMTVDLNLQGDEVSEALRLLAVQFQKSIVPSANVKGTLTLSVKNRTFSQAFDDVLHAAGCGYVRMNEAYYVYTNDELRKLKSETQTLKSETVDPNVLELTMKRIDGTEQKLSDYKGKVVMIVNTASKCGLTPQYTALEKLYQEKKDKGFVILGFPANEFGSQEPGTNAEIKEFCSGDGSQYHVTFPMFEKVVVKGEGVAPLYKKLIAQPAPIGGEPKWNFTKFIVDKSGKVVARFEPKTKPDDAAVIKKIDELLGSEPSGASRRSEGK
jgi:glutathione peroxidase